VVAQRDRVRRRSQGLTVGPRPQRRATPPPPASASQAEPAPDRR
jgi:hypothetical protein